MQIENGNCGMYNSLPIWLIVCSFPLSIADQGWQAKEEYTGAKLAVHLGDVLDRVELTYGHLLRFMTDNATSNYSMKHELQSTLDASGIEWAALVNHIPCMMHVIQLALSAFMSRLAVKGRMKSREAHEGNQHFGGNQYIDIGKSQRLWTRAMLESTGCWPWDQV